MMNFCNEACLFFYSLLMKKKLDKGLLSSDLFCIPGRKVRQRKGITKIPAIAIRLMIGTRGQAKQLVDGLRRPDS